MRHKFNFTKASLAAVECPETADRTYVYDTRVAGLVFCRTTTGTQTFFLYKKVNGRPVRVRIGRFPEVSIEQARTLAAQMQGQIAGGVNPQELKRLARAEATVGEMLTHYIAYHAKPHKKDAGARDEYNFKCYSEDWRNRKLSSIDQPTMQARHAKIGRDNGPYAANRWLALMHTMWNKAAGAVGYTGANPAHGVQKFKEQKRDRFLRADELGAFFKSLADEPNETVRDFFLVALLTGARRGNVLSMRWEDVQLKRAEWRIPDTKNGEPLTVTLSERAVAILTARKEAAEKESQWVFPGHGSKSGHLEEVKSAWDRVLKRAKIANLRPHDLRRTLGSWQAASGASLPVIGKSLGHRSPLSTAVYARLDLDPVRLSVEAASVAMIAAAEKVTEQKEGGGDENGE